MTRSDNLASAALCVNALLDEYIAVHNSLQQQSGIVGLLRPIKFPLLCSRTQRVLSGLKNAKNEIELLQIEMQSRPASSVEQQFIETLSDYAAALVRTVELLLGIVTDLAARTEPTGTLTLRKHLQNAKTYEEARRNYTVLGKQLNPLYRELYS